MELGRRIACARKDAQLIQAELAEAVGRSIHAVRKWEHSENEPSLKKLQEIADVTGCPLAFLVGIGQGEEQVRAEKSSSSAHAAANVTPHPGVKKLADDEHVLDVLDVSEQEIDALRRCIIGSPDGSSIAIKTVDGAIELLQTIRHLQTEQPPE